MSSFLTFVASSTKNPLKKAHFKSVFQILKAYNIESAGNPVWLSDKKAADIEIDDTVSSVLMSHLRDEMYADAIDIFVTSTPDRKKKLLIADMDSTMVEGETLDEMAAHAGIKDQIAEITARAMNGELDFHAAIKERVGLLKGLDFAAVHKTLDETKVSQGAESLVRTMRDHGAKCVLVSGGFTHFTGPIAEKIGFAHHHGNTLGEDGQTLSGEVIPPILDKFAKVEFLKQYCAELGLTEKEAMSIGDGANDLPMLKLAGFGVGYKAKPSVASELKNNIVHGDLSAALYAQGYKDNEFSR